MCLMNSVVQSETLFLQYEVDQVIGPCRKKHFDNKRMVQFLLDATLILNV